MPFADQRVENERPAFDFVCDRMLHFKTAEKSLDGAVSDWLVGIQRIGDLTGGRGPVPK